MIRRRLHLLVIPVAATFAVLPLLVNGCSCGHDFDFHLLNWLEAAKQIAAGNLHPHWAFTPAYNAGEPRFTFYPPLSWTIGAVLTLISRHVPRISPGEAFAYVPILYTWIALCSAGLAAHGLVRRFTTPAAALIASTLYLTNPYTLFTAYERSAYAELLAAAWIPLLLLAILPSGSIPPGAPRTQPISIPLLALAVALLWLTNAPAAVMGCYALALLAALQLAHLYWKARSFRALLDPAGRVLAGTSLGLAIAAFYIVPAQFQRRWVEITMTAVPGMRIADNTLFHHTGDPAHDAVLHTTSLLAVLLLTLTSAALLFAWRSKQAHTTVGTSTRPPGLPKHLLPSLAILTAIIALLLTPFATLIWRLVPELAFLLFPWRMLAIVAAVLALTVAILLRELPLRPPATIALALLIPAALTLGTYRSFAQQCDPEDAPEAQLAASQSGRGFEQTDEYTPIPADNDALQQDAPPFQLLPLPNSPEADAPQSSSPPNPQAPTQTAPPGPAPTHLDLDLPAPGELVLNLRDYPAWRVDRNGAPITDRIGRDDGLLAFTLPEGHSHLELTYRTTPDQRLGDAISAIALCISAPLAYTSIRRRRRRRRERRARVSGRVR